MNPLKYHFTRFLKNGWIAQRVYLTLLRHSLENRLITAANSRIVYKLSRWQFAAKIVPIQDGTSASPTAKKSLQQQNRIYATS